MSTRKLKYEASTKTLRDQVTNHWIGTLDSWDGAVADELDGIGQEMATRWNTHDALVEALDSLMYELKAVDEDYDMNTVYGQCDRLLKSIDPELGDKQE